MGVAVEYPCFASGEPVRLAAETVRTVAADLRRQLLGVVVRPLRIGDLVRKTNAFEIDRPEGGTLRIRIKPETARKTKPRSPSQR